METTDDELPTSARERHVPVPVIFTAIAVIFVALVVRDVLNREYQLDPRRRTWLRLALIFAGVAIALQIGRSLWG